MGQSWFAESGVEKVVLSGTAKTLGDFAFMGCKGLKGVIFPKNSSLEVIGTGCFRGSGLEQIRTPQGLKTIEEQAFTECARLKRVSLNEDLQVLKG